MIKNIVITAVIFLSVWTIFYFTTEDDSTKLFELKDKYSKEYRSPVDHSKLEVLQKDFSSPQEVTEACISCHTERHTELMESAHWNWEREEYIEGRGIVKVGKKNMINNFCIGVQGNEAACTKCHAGFEWKDDSFDFEESSNVDCMVCHDNSGTYKKANNLAGLPDKSVDLKLVAQSVGKPTKENCGSCHFLSGGGNNTKHGDLEVALLHTDRTVDVHMGKDGADLNCIECHVTENHKMKGKLYSVSSMNKDRAECSSCHTERPHKESIINEHTIKVACQTCHIPVYAKVNATKMHWDWEKACKTNDPNYHETDSLGNHIYLAKKGKFVWQTNVTPEYVWFNGTADHYFLGDTVELVNGAVNINTLNGEYKDINSKIIPVKIHRANQPYDPNTNLLIQPKLWDPEDGNNALWVDCKFTPITEMWGKASAEGMKQVGLPYSGEYDFINTRMYWPVNHMVSTKDEALQCKDCHVREDGRLDQLRDFYMPGRDYNPKIQMAGYGIVILSLLGVIVHGGIRILLYYRRKK